jgi:SMC interacting uncharacterized protein involved in chromosome segregation
MRKTRKTGKCSHQATMHGLNRWYEKMFEELGWMVLAHEKGMKDKIQVYKNSLDRLKNNIECKMETIHSPDKKDDLKILCENVKVLITHVHKDFN